MKPTQPLLTALILFLFSVIALQAVLLQDIPDSKVLGENIYGGSVVPCNVVNEIQRLYCSSNLPTPYLTKYPTKYPTPTPKICKEGVSSFSVSTPCGDGKYRFATFSCYGPKQGRLGTSTSCKTSADFYAEAKKLCIGSNNCSITPTQSPTPTAYYPTKYPTPTVILSKPNITSISPNPAASGKSICLYGDNFTQANLGTKTPSEAYYVSAFGRTKQGSFGFNAFDPRGIGWNWSLNQVCFYLPLNLPTDTYNFNICVLNSCSVPGFDAVVNAPVPPTPLPTKYQ